MIAPIATFTLPEYMFFPCFTLQDPYLYPPHSCVEMKMNVSNFSAIDDYPSTIEIKCGFRERPVNREE